MNLDWIKKLKNPDNLLTGDMRIIADKCGIDVFISLFSEFAKSRIHFSESNIMPLKIAYIKEFFNGSNERELSKILDVSMDFVSRKLDEKRKKG